MLTLNQAAGASRRLLPTLVLGLLGACAGTPTPVALPEATIVNRTSKALKVVNYRTCGEQNAWKPLAGSALGAGRSMALTLPEACVDMNAYDSEGKLVGQQRGVKREFPFSWVLY